MLTGVGILLSFGFESLFLAKRPKDSPPSVAVVAYAWSARTLSVYCHRVLLVRRPELAVFRCVGVYDLGEYRACVSPFLPGDRVGRLVEPAKRDAFVVRVHSDDAGEPPD